MASTYITKTPSSTTNQKTWTVSCWVKRSLLSSNQMVWGVNGDSSGNYFTELLFTGSDRLEFRQGGTVGDPYQTQMETNAQYRDTNGWYHIVIASDTTQGTEANRLKMYVNGEQITSFATANYPSQNENFRWHYTGYAHSIGRSGQDNARYFDGIISHFHNIDGTQYQASDFGETDATTGEWKIKTAPSLTYGSFGTFLLKDGNSVTDQSGQGNNWTVGGGTLTKTEDCPSNVFATWNSLSAGSNMAFTFGNTGIRNDVATWNSGVSTLAMGTGKYYWEVYVHGGGDNNTGVSLSSAYGGTHSEVDAGRVVYSRNGYIYREGLSGQSNYSTGVTYGDGDYIGVAFDTENGVLTFYKNGSAVSNGSTTDTSFLRTNTEYIVQCGLYNGGEFRFNFGNGAFGSTQLTGTTYQGDGNIGIFKYQPPTGYTALSTKGLNQ